MTGQPVSTFVTCHLHDAPATVHATKEEVMATKKQMLAMMANEAVRADRRARSLEADGYDRAAQYAYGEKHGVLSSIYFVWSNAWDVAYVPIWASNALHAAIGSLTDDEREAEAERLTASDALVERLVAALKRAELDVRTQRAS